MFGRWRLGRWGFVKLRICGGFLGVLGVLRPRKDFLGLDLR